MNSSTKRPAIQTNNVKKATKLSKKALASYKTGNTKNALKLAQQTIALNGKDDACQSLIGTIYQKAGENEKAIPYFKKALEYGPNNIQYSYQLGMVYKILGRIEGALEQLQTALNINPNDITCLNEAGLLYIEIGENNKANDCLNKAHDLDPTNITTLINLAFHCFRYKLYNEAISFAEQVIKIDPEYSEAYYLIGHTLIMSNFVEKGIEYVQLALSKSDINTAFRRRSILMSYLYSDTYSNDQIFQEHRLWADKFLNYGTYSSKNHNNPNKKLKIGFVSPDFREHSVISFLLPIFNNYNKKEFEYIGYSGVKCPDSVTAEIKDMLDSWRDISRLSSNEIAEQIKHDEVDIVIDLVGHTAGEFINAFALKPAPIQFTYLGYPFSTGLKNMDYRITDNYADPVKLTEHLHTEKLIRISPSFLCYQAIKQDVPIDSEPPFQHNDYITFGSFNNLNKLSNKTIALWAKILKNIPRSKLALKSSSNLPGLLKENVIAQFQMNGISLDRLTILEYNNQRIDHLAQYNKIDICLDTYPYNGTTTTFEALWMGVPVISLCGDGHPSRVGNSILQNIELPQLVASSDQQYIDRATDLANNLEQIQEFRTTLRNKLMSSVLTDAHHFSHEFDKVLREAWVQYCLSINETALTD